MTVPIITVITGEGGSGGALGLAFANDVLMMQYSVYSTISPEGCAAILWDDPAQTPLAAKRLKITADDLKGLDVIEDIIPEPMGGAHNDKVEAAGRLKHYLLETLAKYKKMTGSKIKVISQVHPDMENNDYYVNINKAIDFGVDIIQVQGNWCDWLVRDNKIDVIEKMMNRIRNQGYIAGLASHTVDALIACEEQGIIPDYYMKTMHHDKYWSAHPIENRVAFEVDGKRYLDHNRFHDNLFCLFPDKTIEFVERAKVPVMGFKVLAAGAIKPDDGFNWAFKNGADFICVGMFDFQVVNDVNITIDILGNLQGRSRKWYG